ncbi:MAG: 1-deoxy-D-xylulose-5-phosphate reductoisomerase [Caldithrix sp.]|nr:MAG: 1-deoxy-D-xylulose-5-phosphate reductoisomerase [Caldithrix sp.]TDI94821.1 MAG: 1-deoxy-D-xylulose-5-phosphate reductoisomerase [Caldithrix sp.]
MKRISILGSTGSIGTNCLNVIESQQGEFQVNYLTNYKNIQLLFEQAEKFRPNAVAIFENDKVAEYLPRFKKIGVEVYTGFEGILEVSRKEDVDILVNALVGAVGLQPTLNAIRKNVRIALANKETLVIGGRFVMEKARQEGAEIIPIDSEHSALLQCIAGEDSEKIKCVYLTASGGPFREFSSDDFSNVTVEQALNHPNWDMGQKVTIDSATLMNKGLEVIEAHWLFNLKPAEIQVVIHPQSIIHSMVEFADGSIKAQLGVPDMRIPIQYALTYPKRLSADFPRLDFLTLKELTFEQPDFEKFRCLKLSYQALETGGAAPAVLNAANEVAVNLFLTRKIGFEEIPQIVEKALTNCKFNNCDKVEDLLQYDKLTRDYVLNELN